MFNRDITLIRLDDKKRVSREFITIDRTSAVEVQWEIGVGDFKKEMNDTAIYLITSYYQ